MKKDKARLRAAEKSVAAVDLEQIPPEPVKEDRRFPIRLRGHRDRTKLALREVANGMGIRSLRELPTMPGINALSFTIRFLPGGRDRFVEFVKLAALNGDPTADAWFRVFADLTDTERKRCNLDDVCVASGVKPSALMAAVVGHGMEHSVDVGNLVAAMFKPEVIAALGKSAVKVDGPNPETSARDRERFLQGQGFLPVPKGNQIHVHASANAQAASAASADPSVPRFSSDIEALSHSQIGIQRELADAVDEEPVTIDIDQAGT